MSFWMTYKRWFNAVFTLIRWFRFTRVFKMFKWGQVWKWRRYLWLSSIGGDMKMALSCKILKFIFWVKYELSVKSEVSLLSFCQFFSMVNFIIHEVGYFKLAYDVHWTLKLIKMQKYCSKHLHSMFTTLFFE